MVPRELESQLGAAEFLRPTEIEQGRQRLQVSSDGPGVLFFLEWNLAAQAKSWPSEVKTHQHKIKKFG